AKAALEGVFLVEMPLQLLQLARVAQAFHGLHPGAACLDGEHQAAAHDLPVHPHRARAAYAVLAAGMRAGEPELVAQEIDQVLARLDAALHRRAVDGQRDVDSVVHARSSSTPARCRFVSREWYRSGSGRSFSFTNAFA